MPREATYQARLIRRIKARFPDCVVLKNDPNLQQGILDLSVFYKNRWAMLEVKASSRARLQPNQQHFVEKLNAMSFAALIYPENEEEVLSEMERAFSS